MTYEIFEKKAVRVGSPAITFNRKDRISLNSQAAKIFHQRAVEFVLLLWDKQTCGAALRPLTKRDSRAYKLTYGRVSNNQPNGASFSARSFMNHIGWKTQDEKKTVPATWNDDEQIMEFVLPADCLEDDNQRTLLTMADSTRKNQAR